MWWETVKEFAPYVFALITAYVVAKLADKGSKRGQDQTAAIETKKVELDGKTVDLTVLTESIKALRDRLDDADERQLKSDQRIADLEGELQHEKEQRRLSNAFARTLATVIRHEGITVPQQPAGLDLD